MAAGSGSRMRSQVPKQFLDLGGKPVLRRTIEVFTAAVPDLRVITVLPKEHIAFWKEYCLGADFTCPQLLVPGGFTRFHSVKNALERVPSRTIVAIHDGVRPLVSGNLVKEMFSKMSTGKFRALIPVLPSVDTLRLLDTETDASGNERLAESGEKIDRSRV
ncbi:MAG: 2-C-methyl-D-erythritol 4-phosphate cytidylyltransferase, partial [Bacteroidales bacterium]|nr:2-C-methyl-D-erythritol 4-phosphate cytidylyltransferase [Bacteroidales bacterium]